MSIFILNTIKYSFGLVIISSSAQPQAKLKSRQCGIAIATLLMLLCGVVCASQSSLWSGPVLSRFDRFLLIGPRAEGGPALRPLTKANLHYLSKLLVYSACTELSVFRVALRGQNGPHMFPTVSQNAVYSKLALLPPSKYIKTLLCNHLCIRMKQLRSLKMSLRSARSNFKKALEGPTGFCMRGIRCQRKSKWTARF